MVESDFRITCPLFGQKEACDIDNCPRYLVNVRVLSSGGKLSGEGWCLERRIRHFKSIAFENIERTPVATVAKGADCEPTKIAPPDLANVEDCRRFVSDLAETIEREYKSKIHNHGQAVDYILTGAKSGDLFFEDCKIARQIRTDRNWERSTFFNYSKPKHLPKPKNLRKAARKRATQKKTTKVLKMLARWR